MPTALPRSFKTRLVSRATKSPTIAQFLAADNHVVPEDLSAAELRAEIVAQFQQAFPEYRVLKIIPAPDERARRRQTLRNGPKATLIGTASAEADE
jgi:hypothetical protein